MLGEEIATRIRLEDDGSIYLHELLMRLGIIHVVMHARAGNRKSIINSNLTRSSILD
jgi:hypothetical protein